MFVDLSIADVLFNPLAARQMADAVGAEEIAVFNDTLLQTAAAYVRLVRAQSRTAVLEEAKQQEAGDNQGQDDEHDALFSLDGAKKVGVLAGPVFHPQPAADLMCGAKR